MNNIFGIIVSIIYIAMVMAASLVFEKTSKEASRKFTHIMLSNWWIIAMIYFDNVIWASVLPFCFIIINYLSYKKNILKFMERDEGDENKDSMGTVYYAITLFVLSILTFGFLDNPTIGLVGVAVMGYGDGFAAIIGQSIKSKVFKINGNTKSLAGCLTMFIVTTMIVGSFLNYVGASYCLVKAILVGVLMMIIEAVSKKGTDNLTVPILTSILTALLI